MKRMCLQYDNRTGEDISTRARKTIKTSGINRRASVIAVGGLRVMNCTSVQDVIPGAAAVEESGILPPGVRYQE